MGKKFGKLMKAVSSAVDGMTQEQIAQLERDGQIALQADGQDIVVERADVDIISEDIPGWTVMNEGNITVALDITITPELKNEGVAREIVKRIQGLRKDSGFEITDRITVKVSDNPAVVAAVESFKDYISTQVLANSISVENNDGPEFDFDEFKVNIKVAKD